MVKSHCAKTAEFVRSLEDALCEWLNNRSRMSGDVQVRICEHLRGWFPWVTRLVLLDNDKARLADWREQCRQHLEQDRLKLHPHKAHISPVCLGLDLLGYRVLPEHRRLRNDNGHRFIRKLRRLAAGYAQGRLDWQDIDPSVQSWIGHAKQADTQGLREQIFSEIVFQRARS